MPTDFNKLLNLCAQGNCGLKTDSRKVEAGDIFVAVSGVSLDGAQFIAEACERGAEYIVCTKEAAANTNDNLRSRLIVHDDPREAVWKLAASRWHSGSLPCKIIGITGTNGKTTSSFLCEHILASAGFKVGVLGTITYHWPGFSMPAPLTTPDPLCLHEMLAKMAAAGVEYVIMEVSSHALAQQRVDGIPFSGAVFTNLTQDHLDFHKDMENYFRAKARLFLELPRSDKPIIINNDDPYGRRLLELKSEALSFGLHKAFPGQRHLHGTILRSGPDGMTLEMRFGNDRWRIETSLVGEFNAYNLLGIQGLALELGIAPDMLKNFESFHGVCGRLERIKNPEGLNVFVDYAHTPDALENALKALKGSGFKRLVTVFGCGGNRDRTKRPLMGEAVAKYSDVAILTSDNPRFEEPEAIIEDVLPGLANASHVYVEKDRKKATKIALDLLEKDDALLIAGKGHEDYQIIKGKKLHYSDQEIVREIINCS